MLLSALFFFMASPLYVKHNTSTSLLTGFAQVALLAYKSRKLSFPSGNIGGRYHVGRDSNLLTPSKKLRFLNMACIVIDPAIDISPDGTTTNHWNLCTVQQVEGMKALIKVFPIWSSGIMLSISTSQTSFPVIQASSMNSHLISGFTIPAASYSMFLVVTLIIWVVLYNRALLPLVLKLCGRPVKLSTKLRMGLVLVASYLCMMVAASVVGVRRKKAIEGGYLNNPLGVVVLFCWYEGCCSYLSLLATWREFLFLYISMFGRQRSLLGFGSPLAGICSIETFCHFFLLMLLLFGCYGHFGFHRLLHGKIVHLQAAISLLSSLKNSLRTSCV
ncbi:unnamed protein product [Linum trigynum]|uniref:Uncharacterized protein n=1 Tax=Linum trigynum TaxID=586398 RepID=A0AAV2FEH6_9ROSI